MEWILKIERIINISIEEAKKKEEEIIVRIMIVVIPKVMTQETIEEKKLNNL